MEERNVSISPAVTFLNCSTCFHAALFVCHVNSYFKTAESCSKDLVLACVKTRKKFKKKFCLCKSTQRKKIHFLISFLQMERKILMKLFFPLSHLKKPELKKKKLFLVKNISKIFFFAQFYT